MLGLWTAKLGAQPASGITTGGKVSAFSMNDLYDKTVAAYHLNEDRRNYHEGKGLFRVTARP